MNPPTKLPSPVPGFGRRLLLGAAACLTGAAAWADVALTLAIDVIEGEDWRLSGVAVELIEQPPDRFSINLTLGQVELPQGRGSIAGLRLECQDLLRDAQGWRCESGRLSIDESPIAAQQATWQASYAPDGELALNIPELVLGDGRLALELTAKDGAWSLKARPYRVSVPRLAALSGVAELPQGWDTKGRVSGLATVEGASGEVSQATADLVVDQLNYASPDGTQAAENVVLKAGLEARLRDGGWQFDATVGWPRGALYAEPLFLDAKDGTLSGRVTGSWEAGTERLLLDSWSLELPKTLSLSGAGRFEGDALSMRDLTVAARSDDAGRLYRRLLQPFLIGTAADDMTVTGQVGLALHFDKEGVEQAGFELHGLALEDRQGRFSLGRTDGSVAWDRSRAVPASRLTVEGLGLYRIPTDGFSIDARFAGERIELVRPVVVPVLGGAVALDSFTLTGALMAGQQPRWEASASVRDVSLEQLTGILEWPPFKGTVSGELRDMRYEDRVFSIGGGLTLNAFGGVIRVDDLAIQDPLGTVPILAADATMRGLDLKALTETFSFGRIEGRLDAEMREIRLTGWQPDHFDLHLYTPERDDSRHRISQRAVENLTELGSGVPAGLSATFLSVFEEFRYDRIDVKVALDGDVAELDGLARPNGGYYLVKGSGLPRIDVIGRNRSVAWKDLVERLRQIQLEGAQIR